MALMKELIDSFTDQLKHSIEIGANINLDIDKDVIQNVIITGMGGSGIGGRIVSQITATESKIPIISNCDYVIPEYANDKTLLIVSSYSGNTEETISALEMGIEKSCQVVCITSGGKVKELAEKNGFPCVEIPGGNPPRAMFAYSAIQQFYVLESCGVISQGFTKELPIVVEFLENEKTSIKEIAKTLASDLKGRIPVIYTDSWLQGVAVRWCQQINENSKVLCWTNPMPEMNHNELVGWEGADNRIGVVVIRTPFDHVRTTLRMDICQSVFDSKCDIVKQISSKGDSPLSAALYVVLLGDWLSWYLSEINSVDAVEIKNIIYLKDSLASIHV